MNTHPTTTNYELDGTFWLFLLLAIVAIVGFYWQTRRPLTTNEGFTLPTSLKLESFEDYDAEFRDTIDQTAAFAKEQVDILWTNTQMDAETSAVLDIQGTLVPEFKRRQLKQMETSKKSKCNQKSKDLSSSSKDLNESSHLKQMRSFDWNRKPYQPCTVVDDQEGGYKKGQFTHILALQRTIYEQDDLIFFLRKCAYWLRPGGYLAVQLMEPDDWAKQSIPPLAKKLSRLSSFPTKNNNDLDKSTTQRGEAVRAKGCLSTSLRGLDKTSFERSEIDMIHTKYISEYTPQSSANNKNSVSLLHHTETFQDAANPEKTFQKRTTFRHVDKSIEEITQDIEYCRFQVAGKYDVSDQTASSIYLFRYLG